MQSKCQASVVCIVSRPPNDGPYVSKRSRPVFERSNAKENRVIGESEFDG